MSDRTPPKAARSRIPDSPKVPDKFRDPETGDLRTEALLRSYLELERKLAQMVEVPRADSPPETAGTFRRAVGVPDTPEGYPVEPPHPMIQPDPEVNAQLHAAGFTPEQAQLVYDLAAERMLPAIQELAGEFEAERQLERLVAQFGGPEKWREVAGALGAWGRKNLPGEVFEALSTTYEGVLAMHRMMANGEPGLGAGGDAAPELSEDDLKRLMADPKYWRQRDPATVAKVQAGFQRLFSGQPGG
ncbi:hypothetical protein CKO21_18500 [Rhodovibrio salinarum]|uniref:Uncharacterized protein n=1 Tax=Rhodovibrio salinarum TaxID=1087 RepID=A0A934QLX8_9PROT|nr:hypothetical protein [Rhodovibrio salinarum]